MELSAVGENRREGGDGEEEEQGKEEQKRVLLRPRFGEPKNDLQKWGGMTQRRRCSSVCRS